jgi:ligand-binding SRPBCC domain-containing protein
MKIYSLKRKQLIKRDIDYVWNFFSNPTNLQQITPKNMGFLVTSELPTEMYAGLVITYIIKPIAGLPVNWVTEITHFDKPNYFVDEQRFGPYKFWHHTHKFESTADGVIMEDTVYYGLSFGIFGRIAHSFFVRKRLEQIFDYRFKVLENYFDKLNSLGNSRVGEQHSGRQS